MNKTFITLCAALAAMTFTSCNNEVDMFEPIGTGRATIDLGITSDDEITVGTRATQTADNAVWHAKVGNEAQCRASEVVGKTYTPGEYSITVSNYTDEAAAYAVNDGAGNAYYTCTKDVVLVKGTNTVTMECGKAQNSRIMVDWSGTDGVAGLKMKSVEAVQAEPARSYTYNESGTAYFYAKKDVKCTINYTYNGDPKAIEKTFSAPVAATEYKLMISANSNGTITTLTITYDDEFADGGNTGIEIDAATGEETSKSE